MLPNAFLGDGASLGLGDSGAINSQDDFSVSFSTGAFGNRGPAPTNTILYVVAGAVIAGVSIWAISHLSR